MNIGSFIRKIVRKALCKAAGLPFYVGWTTPAREQMLLTGISYLEANKIQGHYAEFGVWRGDTLATAYRFIKKRPFFDKMIFFAFDSFQGFPELKGLDIHPMFQTGNRAFSIEKFQDNVSRLGVAIERLRIYPGWFSETLAPGTLADSDIPDQSLSFIWADCDLYESTRDILPFIWSKAKSGAVIAFDDWFCFDANPDKGVQLAVREFGLMNPSFTLVPFFRFGWHGLSFILHRIEKKSLDVHLSPFGLI